MSFPRYPAYKDSGVEWLGRVPAHWPVVPMKSVVSCNDEVLPESTPEDYEIEYVEISGVDVGKGIVETSTLTFKAAASRARRVVKDGDVLVSTVRTYLRAIAPVRKPVQNLIASTGFAVLRPKQIVSAYLGYTCQAEHWISEVIARSVGVSYPAINASDLVSLPIGLPPLDEQAAISSFLDGETAKIDALVAEQEQLITLLKEKRQAVISHAVTKGLDPSVPMKDSGVEWLGEVPAHWQVLALKRCCSLLKDGTHLPPARVASGIPLLSVRNVQDGRFGVLDDDSLISEASYQDLCRAFTPQVNDVLLAIVGATLGKTAMIPEGLGAFHIQRSLAIFRTNQSVEAQWLHMVFQSGGFQSLLWEYVGYSAQPGIYLGTLCNFAIPVPPLHEQLKISAFVEKQIDGFDRLIGEAESATSLLQERRSALISAAVTGQIDVRQAA